MIASQILILAAVLSILWGLGLIGAVVHYLHVKGNPHRRRAEMVNALRLVIVVLAAFLFVFSFVFRTACVLLGIGDEVSGQIAFYALVSTNLVGSIFLLVSLRYD